VSRGLDARSLVHGHGDEVPVRAALGRAAVQPDPRAERRPFWPWLRADGALRVGREGDGRRRVCEGEEEPVALGLDLEATNAGEARANDVPVALEHLGVGTLAQDAEHLRRAGDVGEAEGVEEVRHRWTSLAQQR
jgi:hypothetical protein